MSDTPQARRASGLSITPLAAIALGFFLPTVRACGEMQRPIGYLSAHPHTAPWLFTPYLSALLLALVSAVLLARGLTPGPRSFRLAWTALGLSLLGAGATLVGWLSEVHANLTLISWCTATLCIALLAAQHAVRFDGWSRWTRFLLAQASLTAGNTVFVMIATTMWDGAWDAVGAGGHLFVWGTFALAALSVYGARGVAVA